MESLIYFGFEASPADTSLFNFKHGSVIIIILIYVDDILIIGSSAAACDQVISQLSTSFPVKDLGHIHYFLGLRIKRNDTAMHLYQIKYILDLLKRTNMLDSKPCSSPAIADTKTSKHDSEPLADAYDYRSLVGALQYVTWTRPEICYVVNHVSQHGAIPLMYTL
ncbi:uncharacterized protein LOC113280265 [Papaver somniferum]|uniref:uncharacterized protein LOC113280265 n=1 Tax=Papaver somniferum TaxID=3469 RepID=UPI000E702EE4|nr:uncharacterized protein LOC113280265 [Papaver somniferum]